MPIIVASESGAALDTNLLTGGGTDDTVALQSLLDRAKDGTPIHVVIDGPALVTGLRVYSNTTIEFTGGAGLYLADDSYAPVIGNAHPSRDDVVDENIEIRGGFLNGNRSGQPELQFHGWSTQQGWTKPNRDAEGSFIPVLRFFGTHRLTVTGTTLYNSTSFGIWIANVRYVTLRDFTIDANIVRHADVTSNEDLDAILRGPHSGNTDGVHVNGPAQYLVFENLRLRTEDDAVAFNANDMAVDDMTTVDAMGPYVGQGPITDAVVRDVVLLETFVGIRLLSSDQRLDRITIENVSGSNWARMALISNYSSPTGGNVGSVVFRNIAVDPRAMPVLTGHYLQTGEEWTVPIFSLNGAIESVTIERATIRAADARPMVRVGPVARIGRLTADLEIRNADDRTDAFRWEPGGRVDDLRLTVRTVS